MGKLAQDIAAEGAAATSLRSLGNTPKSSHTGATPDVDVLRNPTACQECMSFLMTNREKDIRKQPAYFACMSKLRTALCQCPQSPDEWDASTTCPFHDSLHTVADLTWAISTIMEQESVIPTSAPAVGAAGLQLVMKVQEQAEKEKVESAQATGDASSGSDARTSKAQDPQPKKDRPRLHR